jgi:hypothetical protein
MADIKTKYPASNADTTAITISLASLATSSSLLAGRESDAVVNTTNVDLDHLVGGVITVGTTPTAGTTIQIFVAAPREMSGGTPVWPDVLDGTDSAETITSEGIKQACLKLLASIYVDATTSDRAYNFAPQSVAALFGGVMPPQYVLFVTHNTAVNLNSTAGNHEIHYHRIQAQTV